MNTDKVTPDNNSTGEVNKSKIIGGFLLKANKQLTKPIEKRMRYLNDPTAGPEIWISLQFLLFLTAGPDMGYITTFLNLILAASVSSVQA